jgi:hypothetical protein
VATPWSIIVPYSSAAAATIPNALTGTAVEYVGHAAVLTVYASGDAIGDTFSLSGFSGDAPGMAVIPAGTPVQVASTAGAVKTNENFLGQFAIPANTRLVLAVVTSAAHTGRFLIAIS